MLKTHFVLLLPEVIWLFARFNPVAAFCFLLLALSLIMLFHCLLYHLRTDMNKYLQWLNRIVSRGVLGDIIPNFVDTYTAEFKCGLANLLPAIL